MSRKDRRPQSRPDRNTAEEKSRKATHQPAGDEQGGEGQTAGGSESGPEPGHYTDRGSPGYTPR